MIKLTNENMLTLAEATATAQLPRRRKGKKPHVSRLYKWATAGCNGAIRARFVRPAIEAGSPTATQRTPRSVRQPRRRLSEPVIA